MMKLLGKTGAERAERSLSGFLAQVRAASPCPGPCPHQVVLTAGMDTLARRAEAAGSALHVTRRTGEEEAVALSHAIRAALAEADGLNATTSPARLRDLAVKRATLAQRTQEVQERIALLHRALAWLDDVTEAAQELRTKHDAHPNGVDAPGLLRTLTELGALLNTIADAARASQSVPWGEVGSRRPGADETHFSVEEAKRAFAALARQLEKLSRETSDNAKGQDDGRSG